MDTECDDVWTFFFEQLKIVVDDNPKLCIISDRHLSIAKGIIYPVCKHDYHEFCISHLGKNPRKRFKGEDYLYHYYWAVQAYSKNEFFLNHF